MFILTITLISINSDLTSWVNWNVADLRCLDRAVWPCGWVIIYCVEINICDIISGVCEICSCGLDMWLMMNYIYEI